MIGSAKGRAQELLRSGGRHGTGRAAHVVPAVAVLLVTTATGCSSSPTTPPAQGAVGSATATLAAGKGSPAATKALETSAALVRTQVETVAQPLQSVTASRQVSADDTGPCQVGEPGPWPQRWGFAVRLTLRTTDAPASARTAMDRLTSQGWTVGVPATTPDAIDFDARKNGVVLHVAGEPNPATVTVEGYGPCVGSDGKTQAAG
jgi:hypothetical protein